MVAHINTKRHKEAAKAVAGTKSVSSFFRRDISSSTINAESLWAMFTAKHNLAFLSSDHANKLFREMFPDSEIAKKFACGRTKATAIVKEALSPFYHKKAVNNLSNNAFSLLMDESNDKVDKSCIILVRVLDSAVGDVKTRFLDMPVVNVGNAPNLFRALKDSLEKHGLDFSKAVAFMSDTTNVMKGARSGVQKLIKEEIPTLYDVGCICHLANLTIKAGLQELPIDIDQLFVDIFYYFQHSSKRNQEFVDNWHSLFTSEPGVILKHCPTRWLSLLRCVDRYLRQIDGLVSYFLSCNEQTDKVISITERLQNPFTKPILHFLMYVLPCMDRFNRLFQKSSENTTCELYVEMNRLVRLYAANLMTNEAILKATDNLKHLKFDATNQLPDENLGIGDNTWAAIAVVEQEHDTKPFFASIRRFYLSSIKKMLKKFPFGDSLLNDLGILQPDKVFTYQTNTVLRLAKKFPQLELATPTCLDHLKEEFSDFLLSPSEIQPFITTYSAWDPSFNPYRAAEKVEKSRPGAFWHKIAQSMRSLDGEPRFPLLSKLMAGLLSIPSSNADSERGFSMLRKIHTAQRSNLDHSTIVSLMSLKFNCDSCCYDTKLTSELLSDCKKATLKSLHSSQAQESAHSSS